jgi:hypothetical protein
VPVRDIYFPCLSSYLNLPKNVSSAAFPVAIFGIRRAVIIAVPIHSAVRPEWMQDMQLKMLPGPQSLEYFLIKKSIANLGIYLLTGRFIILTPNSVMNIIGITRKIGILVRSS